MNSLKLVEQQNQIIQLPISVNYVNHWGFWEATRELLQNAIDTKDFKVIKSTYDRLIKIQSNGGTLDLSTLMLGETSKNNDDSTIGKYGEGYKLAMLVLCRMGYNLQIANGNDLWLTSIAPHDQLGSNCLTIEVISDYFEDRGDRVEFVINGMTNDDFDIIESNYLEMENFEVFAEYNDSYCFDYDYDQDEDNIKKVFVGGLFVCDLKNDDNNNYRFSYNFAPNVLELDRDRNAVDSFYLQYYATKLLVDSGNLELLIKIANDGFADVSDYYQPSTTGGGGSHHIDGQNESEISNMALKSFLSKNGENAFPIKSNILEAEKQALRIEAVKRGLVPVDVKVCVYDILPIELKDKVNIVKLKGKVSSALELFLSDNKKHMRSKAVKNLSSLIQSIKLKGE
jgi:hypothetical protein